ncbi:M48 family metallopeptidase [Candidatus Omnitrophota bacterium]
MKKYKLLPYIIVVCLIGCATVPVTGRKQLSLVSSSQLFALSSDSYRQLISKAKLSTDTENTQMLQEVGKRIAVAAEEFMRENNMAQEIQSYRWEFNLIEDEKAVNAFAMPGGKVAVYTGILPVTKDADGLATVVGHEIAHVMANHGGERMSQLLLVNLGGIALATAVRQKPNETQQYVMIAYGLGANVGVLLPYSRTHESESDRIGLILMARAGYDPRKAIGFWERMNAQKKLRPPEFLSTHPAPARRIDDIRKTIPEAMGYYKN